MPRRVMTALAASAALASGLGAQEQEFAPALPRPGSVEALSHELFRAWDVTWQVGEPTPMHRHDFDYFGVELNASRTLLTAPDGSERTVTLEAGRIWYRGRGVTHQETGLSDDPPRHAIIVELEDVPPPWVPGDGALPIGPVGTEPDIENERVAMWRVMWPEGHAEPMRSYERPVLTVFVEDAHVTWTAPDGERHARSYRAGEIELMEAGRAWAVTAGTAVDAVIVELRGGPSGQGR